MGEKIISGVHGSDITSERTVPRRRKGYFSYYAQKTTTGGGQKVIFGIENNNKFHGWKKARRRRQTQPFMKELKQTHTRLENHFW